MINPWIIAMGIIIFTILLIIYLHLAGINIKFQYKIIPLAIGLSGFIFAGLADGVFLDEKV
jgi:hypothetical protein